MRANGIIDKNINLIEEAIKNHSIELNLFESNSLDYIIPYKGKLSNISKLDLSSGAPLKDLRYIEFFTNLSSLDLRYCRDLSDISAISKLTKLQEINISQCESITNYEVLKDIGSLRKISITNSENLKSISFLNSMINLESLRIEFIDNSLNLTPIHSLKNLVEFSAFFVQDIESLDFLSDCNQLKSFSISFCDSLNDISVFSKLTKLNEIHFDLVKSNGDFSSIGHCKNLTKFSLSRCEIKSDLKFFCKLPEITYLNLNDFHNITDLTYLSDLSNIKHLILNDCKKLTNISALSNLKKIQLLDLSSCENISDISPINNLPLLTSLKLTCCYSLKDLSSLSSVPNLTYLDLRECHSIDNLDFIQNFNKLEQLEFYGNNNIQDFTPLNKVKSLVKLSICMCAHFNNIGHISNLKALKHLHLFKCDNLKNIDLLNNFVNLEELSISDCGTFENLKFISKLNKLNNLNLDNCQNICTLEPLKNFVTLNNLKLSNCRQLETLVGLENHINIVTLELSECSKLTNISVISKLNKIVTLEISWCTLLNDIKPLSNLVELRSLSIAVSKNMKDYSPLLKLKNLNDLELNNVQGLINLDIISKLTNLESLVLNGNDTICDITPIKSLMKLEKLHLSSFNKLTDIAPIELLAKITNLSFYHCAIIKNLEPVINLPTLKTLNISWCQSIDNIPLDLLNKKSLQTLIFNSPNLDLPQDLVEYCNNEGKEGYNLCANCLPALRSYYNDIYKSGSKFDREVKLLFIGNGRIGKTSICKVFNNEEINSDEPTTHGINFFNWELKSTDKEPIQINAWDFGGQDLYYGTNRLFHNKDAVYVLLWSSTQDPVSHDGIESEYQNYSLEYWFEYIKSINYNANVVAVNNNYDVSLGNPYTVREYCLKNSIDYGKLRGNLQILDTAFPNIKRNTSILSTIRESIKKVMFSAAEISLGSVKSHTTANSRWKIKREIIEIAQNNEVQLLTQDDYNTICDKHNLDESSRLPLLNHLTYQGIVFYSPEFLEEEIIINLRWARDAIYSLLDRNGFYSKFQQDKIIDKYKGQFRLEEIARMAWGCYTSKEHTLLLHLMLSAKICFDIGNDNNTEEAIYLAPALLQENEPEFSELSREHTEEYFKVYWIYEYDFLCPSIIAKAIVNIGIIFKQTAIYWKNGFIIPFSEDKAVIRVEALYNLSSSGNGQIKIEIRSKEPYRELLFIRQFFEVEYFKKYHRYLTLSDNMHCEDDIEKDELFNDLMSLELSHGVAVNISADDIDYANYNNVCDMLGDENKHARDITKEKLLSVDLFLPFFPSDSELTANIQKTNVGSAANTELKPSDQSAEIPNHLSEGQEIVFSWVHLSDLHIGHGNAKHSANQESIKILIDRFLPEKINSYNILNSKGESGVDCLFFTGDLAQAGELTQLSAAKKWIDSITQELSINSENVFIVPGNHDIVRYKNEDVIPKSLIEPIRNRDLADDKQDNIDTLLSDKDARAILLKRNYNFYATFSNNYAPFTSPDFSPYFSKNLVFKNLPFPIVIAGFNTALLCNDNSDQGKLEFGQIQMQGLEEIIRSSSKSDSKPLFICLSHHPFSEGWLKDEKEIQSILKRDKFVHLCGHTHQENTGISEHGYIEIIAGAAHDSNYEGSSNRFKIASLIKNSNDSLVIRTWSFVEKDREFTLDENVQESNSQYYYDIPISVV